MLILQEICEQTNDNNSQPESTSDSVNSVNDSKTTKISLTYQNEKKRQLTSKLQKSKQYPKRFALWVTRTQFEKLVSKL